MSIVNLFDSNVQISSIIKCDELYLFQKYKLTDCNIIHKVPVICIVELTCGTISPVCIINNQLKIMTESRLNLLELVVNGIVTNVNEYTLLKKRVKKIKDRSKTYLWTSSDNYQTMTFYKIDSWEIVEGGFLKSKYIDDDKHKDYVDNIVLKKMYCSHQTYKSMKESFKSS